MIIIFMGMWIMFDLFIKILVSYYLFFPKYYYVYKHIVNHITHRFNLLGLKA